jgi:hypothetical protein
MNKPEKLLYDYDFINERDKETAIEVLNQIQKLSKTLSLDKSIKQIKASFKVKEIPTLKIEEGLFYEFMRDEKLGVAIQGYDNKKDKDGNPYKVPFISMGANREELDDIMLRLIIKIKNIVLSEIKNK